MSKYVLVMEMAQPFDVIRARASNDESGSRLCGTWDVDEMVVGRFIVWRDTRELDVDKQKREPG